MVRSPKNVMIKKVMPQQKCKQSPIRNLKSPNITQSDFSKLQHILNMRGFTPIKGTRVIEKEDNFSQITDRIKVIGA